MQLYSIAFQKRLKLLQKDIGAQIVLSKLPTLKEIDENTVSTIEDHVSKMCASKDICKVNDLRTQMFLKRHTQIKPYDRLKCVKKFDSSLVQPCKEVLLLKIKEFT